MAKRKPANGYRGVVEAKSGLLLGGTRKHVSTIFKSDRDATRWVVVVAQTNRDAGRDVGAVYVETIVNGAVTESTKGGA